MGFERIIVLAALGLAPILGGVPAMAAPPEPLVVTQLADPDPNYVPPPLEPRHGKRNSDAVDENPTLDGAMREFGQALGQAAMVQQQAIEERCRTRAPDQASASAQSRFAWAAACSYTRH